VSILFNSIDELYSFIGSEHRKRPTAAIDIVTFSLYAGFSKGRDWSTLYPSQVRRLVDEINKSVLRIVVGIPNFVPCKPDCGDCKKVYKNRIDSLVETKKALSMNIRFIKDCHMKMYRIGPVYVVGGMNLTGSRSIDIAMTVEDKGMIKLLQAKFDSIWSAAKEEPCVS
jgi:hypothetical protein